MSYTKVELPIEIDNIDCVTECWTFNRMIILKTSPYYEDWIASHYRLFVVGGRFHFEQLLETPEVYDTILYQKQIKYFELTEEEIVSRFRQEISNGCYLNVMTKPYVDNNWYHEIVLYGYDDNDEVFYAIGLEGHHFTRVKYSYQFMIDMLKEMKGYFKKVGCKRGLRLSEVFQYPITAFRVRENYCNEGCVYRAFHKLRVELNGQSYGEGIRDVNTWTYTGLKCLLAWGDLLKEVLQDNSEISKFLKVDSVVKLLHEHRKMMLVSMKYIQRKWGKALKKEFVDNVQAYQICCENIERWKILTIKYKATDDKELLKKILEEIPNVYEQERSCLDNMVNHCIDWDKFNEYYI